MAINWTGFTTSLLSIHQSSNKYNTSQVAQAIEDAYVTAVSAAQESTANNTLISATVTTGLLKTGIENALNSTVGTFGAVFDVTDLNSGLAAFWLGAKFNPVTPATGQSTVSTIDVLNGGTGSSQPVPAPSDSNIDWVVMLADYFQGHASTISGTLTGVSSTSPFPPLIVPFVGVT